MAILYLDRVSFLSLSAIICRRVRYSEIFYFDISPYSRLWIRLFTRLGLLHTQPKSFDFSRAGMLNKKGENAIQLAQEVGNTDIVNALTVHALETQTRSQRKPEGYLGRKKQ